MVRYIIVNSMNKRVRIDGGLFTPSFDYPIQAQRYIENILGNSPTLRILRVDK